MVAMKSQMNLSDVEKVVPEESIVDINDDVITDLEKEVGFFFIVTFVNSLSFIICYNFVKLHTSHLDRCLLNS